MYRERRLWQIYQDRYQSHIKRHNELRQQSPYTMKSIQRWSILMLHLHISKYSRVHNGPLIVSISLQIIIKRNNIAVKSASWNPQQFAGANIDKSALRPTIRLFRRSFTYSPSLSVALTMLIHQSTAQHLHAEISVGIYIVVSSIQAR